MELRAIHRTLLAHLNDFRETEGDGFTKMQRRQWSSLFELQLAGFVEASKDAMWRITDDGIEIVEMHVRAPEQV